MRGTRTGGINFVCCFPHKINNDHWCDFISMYYFNVNSDKSWYLAQSTPPPPLLLLEKTGERFGSTVDYYLCSALLEVGSNN